MYFVSVYFDRKTQLRIENIFETYDKDAVLTALDDAMEHLQKGKIVRIEFAKKKPFRIIKSWNL